MAMTQQGFAAWVRAHEAEGDPHRYELVEGRVVVSPPAGYPHGSLESNLQFVIAAFVRAHRIGYVFGSSQGFALATGDILEPDVSYVSRARWASAPPPEEGKFLAVVPDLVVEVLSPSTARRDRGDKRRAYERAGVREYWLADGRGGCITQLVRAERRWGRSRTCKKRLVSHVLAGLDVDVRDVLDV